MKPLISKKETIDLNGQEITLIGESYEQPIKRNQEYMVYSQVLIKDWRGAQIHPGFSFVKPLSEEELQTELDFYKRSIKENPQLYFPK